MKIRREKLALAKARACMSTEDIIKAGILKGTLNNACRGEVQPHTAGRIAKVLGVDVTEIIEILTATGIVVVEGNTNNSIYRVKEL